MRGKLLANSVLSILALAALARCQDAGICGREDFGKGHPYRMSYGVLKDYIEKSEKHIPLPPALNTSLLDDHVSVEVHFDEIGKVTGCTGVAVREHDRPVPISPETAGQVESALCSSISKWKFRPLPYCGKAVPVSGPVVFIVREKQFELR